MEYILVLLISAAVSFFVHDFLDRRYIGITKRDVKLIVKGYHFHHSFFGAVIIVLALLFTGGGYVTVICCGYGVGNIWQHKLTHNRINEKGMVFVTRFIRGKRHVT
ncbi:MAG TPA: hypothetical protein VEC17_00930 [Candidatus Binatia bacterium]|nr:hypothetical protein [Candidatus Binatia bacterium]